MRVRRENEFFELKEFFFISASSSDEEEQPSRIPKNKKKFDEKKNESESESEDDDQNERIKKYRVGFHSLPLYNLHSKILYFKKFIFTTTLIEVHPLT